uniref:Clathrin light chain n=1 Tax=Sinocyclocheilus grahami TaxID=75366 RepID=A0A672K289_SINGR
MCSLCETDFLLMYLSLSFTLRLPFFSSFHLSSFLLLFYCPACLCIRIADKAFYKQPNSDAIGFVVSEEAFLKECDDDSPGTEWEKVARLCDFNPKTSRQTKDVSRMRSVLISLKQTPLVR